MTANSVSKFPAIQKPSREEAREAVRTLLRWAGENPEREGLIETPERVVKSFEEHFAGYEMDPVAELTKVFEDIEGYDDIILLRGIRFHSYCEHHIHPIVGKATVAYWPDKKIVGISKLARVVDIFAKRMVSQEVMTQNIINTLQDALQPRGSAVQIEAVHFCMSSRGVEKEDVATITNGFSGIFKDDAAAQRRFLDLAK